SMFFGIGTLAFIAIDDPNFALEPDYYRKALHWDRNQAQLRENDALGYELRLREPLVISAAGSVQVELELKSPAGAAISGATLEVEAFPNAFAGNVEHLVLREVAPGVYTGQIAHGLLGLWELRCAVSVGSAHYARALRTDVLKRSAA
ncbi:MAG TPA: FixH family protein, partial [Polyangiaceae bacterium]|nr:FixH family protein [Polyangiaceae bacterium]